MARFPDCDVIILCGGFGAGCKSVVSGPSETDGGDSWSTVQSLLVEHFYHMRHGARRFIFQHGGISER